MGGGGGGGLENQKGGIGENHNEREGGVSNGLCEHASTAFYFASTGSDQIRLASSEHSRKCNWRAASTS